MGVHDGCIGPTARDRDRADAVIMQQSAIKQSRVQRGVAPKSRHIAKYPPDSGRLYCIRHELKDLLCKVISR